MTGRAARLRAAGAALDRDQRYAALAAAALLLTMFLPWYEKSVITPGSPEFAHETISAFGAVSFVEAAIFLVSAGVLVLVLTRAEGGRYHLPGGDGTVIFAAGLWASALIFYRVFDRPSINGAGVGASVGIQWGFFVAFVAAGALAVAGQRMRAASRPASPVRASRPDRYRPPQPRSDFDDVDDDGSAVDGVTAVVPQSERRTEVVPRSERRTEVAPLPPDGPRDRRVTRADAEELTFEGPEVVEPPPLRGRGSRSRRGRTD